MADETQVGGAKSSTGLKQGLLDALSRIQTSGSFASFAGLKKPPPAGLVVDGIGAVTMPLSQSQAAQLVAAARQAPYGKGSETIVDTSVRNTWELDATRFSFEDPAWPGYLESLCRLVGQRLGIDPPIRAEPYKMLLYEKGAMFKPHTDTEKIPNMFGTLKKVFKTSETAQSIVCWYSDVSHEVLPVTSGIRWVLTYNLALDAHTGPASAALQQLETRALGCALRPWLAEDKASRQEPFVYHLLDHDYTEANTSLKALKARDLVQVQALQHASAELPIHIFLALLELEEMGSCYYDHWRNRKSRHRYDESDDDELGFHELQEVFESSCRVKTLVDLEGHVVAKGLRLNQDNVLQQDCFDHLEAEESYEGYMGNSGPTATHWYRTTAVAIVPSDSLVSFFNSFFTSFTCDLNSSSPLECLPLQIRYLARACLGPHAPSSSFAAMQTLCQSLWKDDSGKRAVMGATKPSLAGDVMRDVLKVAFQRPDAAFFEQAVSHQQDRLHTGFFAWMRQQLKLGQGGARSQFQVFEKRISSAVLSYSTFGNRFGAVAQLVPISDDACHADSDSSWVIDWARQTLCSCLDACKSKGLGKDDGPAMLDAALYFQDPHGFLLQTVVPLISSKQDSTAFFLAFLARLREQSTKGPLPAESSMHLYRSLAKSFITKTDFTQAHSPATAEGEAAKKRAHATSSQPQRALSRQRAVSHLALADFFSGIIEASTEGDDLVALLISRLVQDASRLPAGEFHYLWLPLLHDMITTLDSNGIALDTPPYQKLFVAILKAYIHRYVGQEPPRATSLARRGVPCPCRDCVSLNAFLTNPTQIIGRFPVGKDRRMHLHRALDMAGVGCTHLTERIGSPNTLIVTKTLSPVEQRHQAWKARQAKAAEQIRDFEPEDLSLLLGPDYADLLNMAHLDASTEPPRVPHRAAAKRKLPMVEVEVIDLTSD